MKLDKNQQRTPLTENIVAIKGASILLVEDNVVNKELAVKLLTNAGFRVEVAENGRESIEMLDKRTYDIVLMDMQMPVMDGITATREIRKDPRFKDLPIIAMTANVMDDDIEACSKAGMWDHIGKPIELSELFGKLLKWIKPHQLQEIQEPTPIRFLEIEKEEPGHCSQDNLPADIPGLDIRLGLKRAMGKKPLYFDLLKKYIDNQKEVPEHIHRSLVSGDYGTAQRLAHTVKGVSGNIGASRLQQSAADLEKVICNGLSRGEIWAMFETFAEVHGKLITGLMKTFPEADPKNIAKVDKFKSDMICEKMTELLADNDSEALTYLEAQNDALCGVLGTALFASFTHAVNQYDFENALKLISLRAKQNENQQ